MNNKLQELEQIIRTYYDSFYTKTYNEENNDTDLLMNVFGISPDIKRENRQYWGRELGMCWQRLITFIAQNCCEDFSPAFRIGQDEPIDLIIGNDAIDTKYRIGSGDSGTLKKFKKYGKELSEQGYNPVLLILREDNLDAAISACCNGGWTIYTGDQTFEYILQKTGFDFKTYLISISEKFQINRQ